MITKDAGIQIAEEASDLDRDGSTIRSIGDIVAQQRLSDNNDEFVSPKNMIAELRADNQRRTWFLLEIEGGL
jgi:starvation-inducible DNA-binding protein